MTGSRKIIAMLITFREYNKNSLPPRTAVYQLNKEKTSCIYSCGFTWAACWCLMALSAQGVRDFLYVSSTRYKIQSKISPYVWTLGSRSFPQTSLSFIRLPEWRQWTLTRSHLNLVASFRGSAWFESSILTGLKFSLGFHGPSRQIMAEDFNTYHESSFPVAFDILVKKTTNFHVIHTCIFL
jgi:hypothetical protein